MKSIAKYMATAILACATGSASAFVPSQDGVADIVIRHSGATSSSQSLLRSVIALCDPAGDNHVFDSEVAGAGDRTDFFDPVNRHDGDYFVVACEVAATTTLVDGALSSDENDVVLSLSGGPGSGTGGLFTMLYYKRDVGGSAMGVQPIANNSDVGFMSVTADCPSSPTDRWVDCADAPTVSYVGPSHVGTSTVEPFIFTAPANRTGNDIDWNNDGLANNNEPTRFEVAALPSQTSAYLTFGVPANYRLYTALQYAQFPAGHPEFDDCNPAGANYGDISVDIDNAASEKCMPNLSKQQVNSLFVISRSSDMLSKLFAPVTFGSDTVQSVWDFIPDVSGPSAPYAKDTYQGQAGGGTVTDDFVGICRGTEGTGTSAQHSLFYHNYPCDRNFTDFVIDGNQPEIEFIFAFNGTTESTGAARVSDCLLAFDDGTNPGTNSPNPSGLKIAAIGLQSAARGNNNEDDDHNWRFLKIDGHSPSLKNAHGGKYEQVYAESWQTAPIATGNELAVIDALIAAFSTHEHLAALNGDQTFGQAGWLANSGTDSCADCDADTTLEGPGGTSSRPVYPFVRQSGSGDPQSCAIPKASPNIGEGIIIGD